MEMLEEVVGSIKPFDEKLMAAAKKRLDSLTKPLGSLGRLEELAQTVVGITGQARPVLKNKVVFTLAGDHGVVSEGVSAYPQEVTPQMVYNFLSNGAGINVLAKHAGARVVVADFGVAVDLKPDPKLVIKKIGYGTKNIANGPAMTRTQAIQSIEEGINLFMEELIQGIDLAATGDMGIGNTTPSSAIAAVMTGKGVEDVTGRGTGIDDKGLKKKIATIKKALEINSPDPTDPIDVLSKVGGFEIGGIAGIILAAASQRRPVLIDGFISGAGALIAAGVSPNAKNYMIASHTSVEAGHKAVLEHLGLKPLLNLDLRLGEGTGAVLAMSVVEASVKIMLEMATFENAGVSQSGK